MTTAKSLSKIIQLPGAATEPVIQNPRRAGRYPAKVTKIQQGNLIKAKEKSKEKIIKAPENDLQKLLATEEIYFLTIKKVYESALSDLQNMRQRAGVNVKP